MCLQDGEFAGCFADEQRDEGSHDPGSPRPELCFDEVTSLEQNSGQMVRVTLREREDWRAAVLGAQATLSCSDMLFRIQEVNRHSKGRVAVDLLPVDPGWKDAPSLAAEQPGILQVLGSWIQK
eukprot:symbB.v1.2.012462.t1/scaffold858.1/size157433/10